MLVCLIHLYSSCCASRPAPTPERKQRLTTRTTIIGGLAAAALIAGLGTAATAAVRQAEHGYGLNRPGFDTGPTSCGGSSHVTPFPVPG